jgi:hypothetical protein
MLLNSPLRGVPMSKHIFRSIAGLLGNGRVEEARKAREQDEAAAAAYAAERAAARHERIEDRAILAQLRAVVRLRRRQT